MAPTNTPQIFQVDSFTSEPFSGNPAGVCFPASDATDEWMQGVAAEMNVAETAFLIPDGPEYQLRWFTPAAEVDLCGHATLAAAHVLWNEQHVEQSRLKFHTRSGILTAARQADGIELDFPSTPPSAADIPDGLLAALGLTADAVVFAGRTRFDVLLQLQSPEAVAALNPDMRGTAACDARGVIVTAAGAPNGFSADDIDFTSRFFAPAVGVDEDPVTGSAHCALTPFWVNHFQRNALRGRQISARGGTVAVQLKGDRVLLRGQAVTVLRGQFVG